MWPWCWTLEWACGHVEHHLRQWDVMVGWVLLVPDSDPLEHLEEPQVGKVGGNPMAAESAS